MSTSTSPNTKVQMLPLALSTTLTTPIRAPKAEISSRAVRAPGCWSFNMQEIITQTVIPIRMKALKILSKVLLSIFVEYFRSKGLPYAGGQLRTGKFNQILRIHSRYPGDASIMQQQAFRRFGTYSGDVVEG